MKSIFRKLILGLMCAAAVSACDNADADAGRSVLRQAKSVNKLVFAQMSISKMATVDDISLSDAKGMKQTLAAISDAAKVGTRKAAYSYDTYLNAFMDMSTLTPEDVKVDTKARTIEITLPPIQAEFAGRDMEFREEHYRVSGLRSEIDAAERAAIKEQMNTSLKNEVEEKPFFKEKIIAAAKAKAENYFGSLLGSDGYKVTVNFK